MIWSRCELILGSFHGLNGLKKTEICDLLIKSVYKKARQIHLNYPMDPVLFKLNVFISGIGGSQQCKARSVPSNLAIRATIRSGGGPLATIVEQGSLSTLNSHNSPLGADRFPTTQVVENASPKDTTPRCSSKLDTQMVIGNREREDEINS